MNLRPALFIAALLHGRLVAQAQSPDTVHLAPIVVTATRIPTALDAVAPTVSILPGAQLRLQGIATVADALRGVPGLAVVQSGSPGAVTSVFLRGGQSDYVKVLVDGVPVNQPGGTYDWAGLTLDNVDRIEVLRGPASVLYGSDAVAGVVQIFTRRGGPERVSAAFEAGRYHSEHERADVTGGGANGATGYAITLSRFTTDGLYRFNSQDRNSVASASLRTAGAAGDAALTLRYEDRTYHFPTSFSGSVADVNQYTFEHGPTIGLDAGRVLSPKLEARLLVGFHQTEGGYVNPPDSPADSNDYASHDRLRRANADLHVNARLGPGTIVTAGASAERESELFHDRCSSPFGDCSSVPVDTSRFNAAVYGQASAPAGSHLSLNGGVRIEDNQRFGTFVTGRLGIVYRTAVAGGLRIRGSAGNAFKEPTFYENYAQGFVKGNPDLRPEQSRSWELGVERRLGPDVLVTLTYFAQHFRDMIDYVGTPPTPGGSNYLNVAAAKASGAEVEVGLTPRSAFSLTASYTYLVTRVTKAGFDSSAGAAFAPGAPLIRRPRHSGAVEIARGIGSRSRLSLIARYAGQRADQDFVSGTRVNLRAYAVFAVSGSSEPWSGFTITARVENATDRAYAEVLNFPASRRSLFVGGQLAR